MAIKIKELPTFVIYCSRTAQLREMRIRSQNIENGYLYAVIDCGTGKIVGIHKKRWSAENFINFFTTRNYGLIQIKNLIYRRVENGKD